MLLDGYIYCCENISWQKVFSCNVKLKNINNALYESCISCDINNGCIYSLKPYNKKCNNTIYTHLSTEYWIIDKFRKKGLSFRGNSYSTNIYPKVLWNIKNEMVINNAVQVVIIENKYAYFIMSTFNFWKDINDKLRKMFNTINLGGYLIDLDKYEFVKNHLQKVGYELN